VENFVTNMPPRVFTAGEIRGAQLPASKGLPGPASPYRKDPKGDFHEPPPLRRTGFLRLRKLLQSSLFTLPAGHAIATVQHREHLAFVAASQGESLILAGR
jgi:hypothetical protein